MYKTKICYTLIMLNNHTSNVQLLYGMLIYTCGRDYTNSSRSKWWEVAILYLPSKVDFLLIDNLTDTNQHAIKFSTNINSRIFY